MSIWHADEKPKRPGVAHRLVRAVTLTLAAALMMSGYLGLRALVWDHPGDLSRSLLAGVVAGAAIGGVVNLISLIGGTRLWRALGIDGVSVQVGALVGMTLYGGYNTLAFMLRGSDDLARTALQGGIDGLLIGALAGVLVAFVDSGGIEFSRVGCGRYLLLFFGVLLLLGIGILIESLTRSIVVALAVFAVLLVAVKLVLRRFFRKRIVDSPPGDSFGSATQPTSQVDYPAGYGILDDGYGDEAPYAAFGDDD